jgi:transcriptional regulator with XRE-family HTH domain
MRPDNGQQEPGDGYGHTRWVNRMSDFAVMLDRLISERGISLHQLASQVPCSAGHISNLRNGKKQPSPTIAERLDDILGADGELARQVPRDSASADLPDSRALLEELTGHAIEVGQWAETSHIVDGTIAQLHDALDWLAHDYLCSPPGPLVYRAAGITRRISELLKGHQRLRHIRELYLVGAKAYAFLSWVAGDLGQLPAAAAYGRAALILADECGHPGARSLAFCALSKTAYWDRRPRRAADYARRGYDCAPANSTRALLACQEGDASELPIAIDAIRRAWEAQNELRADDDLPGIFSCGRVRTANYTIGVHLRAGEPGRALETAIEAATAGAGEDIGYGTWGQIQIGAAIAYLGTSELDGAAEQLTQVLALPPDQRLATLTGRLRTVAPSLRSGPYANEPRASGLAENIRAYCQDAVTARALPPARDGGSR